MKNPKISIILMIAVSILTVYLLNSFGGGIKWWKAFDFFFENWWGIFGFFSLVVSWCADAMIIYLLVRRMSKSPFPFSKAFKTSMIGSFFNKISPSSSGGEVMQVLYLGRTGFSPGISSSVMVMRFIIKQSVLVAIGGFGIFKVFHIISGKPAVLALSILGMAISVFAILFFMLFNSNEKTHRWVSKLIGRLANLFKFSKRLEPKIDGFIDKIDSEFDAYSRGVRELSKKPGLFVWLFAFAAISALAYLFLVYTVLASLGLTSGGLGSLLDALSIQALATMIVFFSPTPGSSGVAEGGFYLFFSMVVPGRFLGTVTFEWRLLSYFIPLLFSFVFVITESARGLKK